MDMLDFIDIDFIQLLESKVRQWLRWVFLVHFEHLELGNQIPLYQFFGVLVHLSYLSIECGEDWPMVGQSNLCSTIV
jgi:hypothetical protein